MYFIQQPSRVRKFIISGVYKTGLSDFDDIMIIGDIKHIQSLNNWNNQQLGGYEISINNFDRVNEYTKVIDEAIDYDLKAQSIKETNPQIFDWLDLMNVNVVVIIILMLIVAVVNIITSFLILILEKTKFIGILKSLGTSNWSIRKVFMYNSMYLVSKGLLWGNIIALLILFIQYYFQIISLDPETYYMETVTISFDLFSFLMLNIGTLIVCFVMMILPTIVITKISAVKAIRFE